jgi:hypothetical protein
VTKGAAFPPLGYPTTARPWRRGRPIRGGEARRKKKGTQGPALLPGWRARVLGCTLARGHRARVVTRTNVNASANSTARCHERERHGAAYDGEKDSLSQNVCAR